MESFSRARLTIARQSRALQVQELAGLVGCTSKTITNYEHGPNVPDDRIVDRLATVLGFPAEFFYAGELETIAGADSTFRARRAMPAWLQHKALAYGHLASECVSSAFRQRFKLPALDVPDLRQEADLQSRKDPHRRPGNRPDNEPGYRPEERAARALRAFWNLGEGPIDNMVHLLESKGVELYWLHDDTRVDAFSFWHDKTPYILLNSAKGAGDRSRFDAAHELAHLVLHRDAPRLDSKMTETEADRFAAEFLVPGETFRDDSPELPILSEYEALKKFWGVSMAALIRRSYELGKLSEWHYKMANIELSASGYRRNEPSPIVPEASHLHDRIFARLYEQGVSAGEFAVGSAHLSRNDVLQLCPVAWRYVVERSSEPPAGKLLALSQGTAKR